MRLQGKITNWNDDKGFGFVEANGGGERAFVHVKAFKPRTHRPVNDGIITYYLVRQSDNRYKAENIKFARDTKIKKIKNKTKLNGVGAAFTSIFCVVLMVLVFLELLPMVVPVVYFLMSVITYIAYALDKLAAQAGRWRTSENTLHLMALTGGWPGACYAQNSLRHKSSKRDFQGVFWMTVLLNLGGLVWLHIEGGTIALNSAMSALFK